jgi:hypothetical protein
VFGFCEVQQQCEVIVGIERVLENKGSRNQYETQRGQGMKTAAMV